MLIFVTPQLLRQRASVLQTHQHLNHAMMDVFAQTLDVCVMIAIILRTTSIRPQIHQPASVFLMPRVLSHVPMEVPVWTSPDNLPALAWMHQAAWPMQTHATPQQVLPPANVVQRSHVRRANASTILL